MTTRCTCPPSGHVVPYQTKPTPAQPRWWYLSKDNHTNLDGSPAWMSGLTSDDRGALKRCGYQTRDEEPKE